MSYLAEANAEPCSLKLPGEGKYSMGTGGLFPPLQHPSHSHLIFLSLNPSVLCQETAQDTPDSELTPCPFPLSLIHSVPGGTFSSFGGCKIKALHNSLNQSAESLQ